MVDWSNDEQESTLREVALAEMRTEEKERRDKGHTWTKQVVFVG